MNERASVDRLSRRVLSEKFDRMGFGTGFEWVTFLSLFIQFLFGHLLFAPPRRYSRCVSEIRYYERLRGKLLLS